MVANSHYQPVDKTKLFYSWIEVLFKQEVPCVRTTLFLEKKIKKWLCDAEKFPGFQETGPSRVPILWEETGRNGLARTREHLLKFSFNPWQYLCAALSKGQPRFQGLFPGLPGPQAREKATGARMSKGKSTRRGSVFLSPFFLRSYLFIILVKFIFYLLIGFYPSYQKGKKECGSFSSFFGHFAFRPENGFISYNNFLHCTGKSILYIGGGSLAEIW